MGRRDKAKRFEDTHGGNCAAEGSGRDGTQQSCAHARYDQCSINGPTVLDSKTLTFFTMSSSAQPPAVENIQPYPRKFDGFIMPNIKNFTLTSVQEARRVRFNTTFRHWYSAPAGSFEDATSTIFSMTGSSHSSSPSTRSSAPIRTS
ncbi:hypothetical protein ACFX14_011478 [Malus domestica]